MSTDRFIAPQFDLDERVAGISSQAPFAVKFGPSSSVNYVLNDSSASSADNPSTKLSFNRNFDTSLFLDRVFRLRASSITKFDSTFTADAGVWGRHLGKDFTIKGPFPLQRMVKNSMVSINGTPHTIENNIYLEALSRMVDEEDLAEASDFSAVMHQKYLALLEGDPANGYGNTAFADSLKPNNRFNINVAVAPKVAGATNAGDACEVTITMTLCEPIFHPYLLLSNSRGNQAAFTQVQSVTIDLTMDANASPLLFKAGIITANSQSSHLADAKIDVTGFRAPDGYKAPSRNVIPYLQPSFAPTNVPAINNGASQKVNSVVRNLTRVPEFLYIYFRKKNGDQYHAPDNSLVFQDISINWDNQSNLLSELPQEALYSKTKMNGCNLSWAEFSGSEQYAALPTVATTGNGVAVDAPLTLTSAVSYPNPAVQATMGGYLLFAFAQDIPCKIGSSPGTVGPRDLSVSVTAYNQTGADIAANTYEMVMVTLDASLFITEAGSSKTSSDLLSGRDALEVMKMTPSYQMSSDLMIGGSWLSKAWKGVKKGVKSAVKVVAPVAKQILASSGDPRAEAAAGVLGALGAGSMVAGGGASHDDRFY